MFIAIYKIMATKIQVSILKLFCIDIKVLYVSVNHVVIFRGVKYKV